MSLRKDADLENAILSTDFELLDMIRADNSSKSFDIMLEETKANKNGLKSVVKQLDLEYDFVFIDWLSYYYTFSYICEILKTLEHGYKYEIE